MTEYTATVRVEDGSMTVTRPHPAPDEVDSVIDDVLYRVRDGRLLGIQLTIETADELPAIPQADDPLAPRQPGSPPPARDDAPTVDDGQHAATDPGPVLSASATGSLNPPVPPTVPDPLGPGA